MDTGGGRVELELIGTRIDVVVAGSRGAELEQAIRSAWDRCLAAAEPAAAPGAVVHAVLDDDASVLEEARSGGALASDDELGLMSVLTSSLTLAAIEARHGQLLMLHACALADPVSGSSVVLVAPSGTGKTTAALTLGTELAYLTDETAAIGLDDVIVPYPKPLSLLADGRPPKEQVSPTSLGLLDAPPAPRLAAIALLDRSDQQATATMEPVPTLGALAAIAEQSSAIQLFPRPLHLLADLLDRTGGLRRITYHEVADAAPLVMELLRGSPR